MQSFQTPRVNHSRSSSVSSLLTSSNGSTSQGYGSATASPTTSTNMGLSNPTESESVIAKIQFAGKDDLLYKKIRVSEIHSDMKSQMNLQVLPHWRFALVTISQL